MNLDIYRQAKLKIIEYRKKLLITENRSIAYNELIQYLNSLNIISVKEVLEWENENICAEIIDYADCAFKKRPVRVLGPKSLGLEGRLMNNQDERNLREKDLIPDTILYQFARDYILNLTIGTPIDGVNLDYCKEHSIGFKILDRQYQINRVYNPSKNAYLLRGPGVLMLKGLFKNVESVHLHWVSFILKTALEYWNIPDISIVARNDVLCKGLKVGAVGSFETQNGVADFSARLSFAFDKTYFKNAFNNVKAYDRVNSVHTLTGITLTEEQLSESLEYALKLVFGGTYTGSKTQDELLLPEDG